MRREDDYIFLFSDGRGGNTAGYFKVISLYSPTVAEYPLNVIQPSCRWGNLLYYLFVSKYSFYGIK